MSHVLALCGGVGGSKLAFGLSRLLPPDALTIVVNTGDDFEHLGLHVSPDIDTVAYTLSGLANREQGWGLQDETWRFMDALARLGEETWFRLGDADLAMHVARTRRLKAGQSLSQITHDFMRSLGVAHAVVPMSDQAVRTFVGTDAGELDFQTYFVRQCCVPQARHIRFESQRDAVASEGFRRAMERPDLGAVIICPSNPYLSVDPILSLPDVRLLLQRAAAPVVAVSPIMGGQAFKGPTAKLMRELGHPTTTASIVDHYGGLLDGVLIDRSDAAESGELAARGVAMLACDIAMHTDADRIALARATLDFAFGLKAQATQ